MNLRDVPPTPGALAAFAQAYETRHFCYADTNRRVADATVRIVEDWFPVWLRPLVKPAFATLISEPLRRAFGYPLPGRWFRGLIEGSLWLRKWPLRWVTFEPYPKLIENDPLPLLPVRRAGH